MKPPNDMRVRTMNTDQMRVLVGQDCSPRNSFAVQMAKKSRGFPNSILNHSCRREWSNTPSIQDSELSALYCTTQSELTRHQCWWLGPLLYRGCWRTTLMLRYLYTMLWLFLNVGFWGGKGRGTNVSWCAVKKKLVTMFNKGGSRPSPVYTPLGVFYVLTTQGPAFWNHRGISASEKQTRQK